MRTISFIILLLLFSSIALAAPLATTTTSVEVTTIGTSSPPSSSGSSGGGGGSGGGGCFPTWVNCTELSECFNGTASYTCVDERCGAGTVTTAMDCFEPDAAIVPESSQPVDDPVSETAEIVEEVIVNTGIIEPLKQEEMKVEEETLDRKFSWWWILYLIFFLVFFYWLLKFLYQIYKDIKFKFFVKKNGKYSLLPEELKPIYDTCEKFIKDGGDVNILFDKAKEQGYTDEHIDKIRAALEDNNVLQGDDK